MKGITSYDRNDWKDFLERWNQEFLKEVELSQVKPSELVEVYSELKGPLERRWLGGEPATADQVHATESRLGVEFPSDYVSFLSVSNGWVGPGFSSYGYMISPIEEVDYYVVRNPDLLQVFIEGGDFYYTSGKVNGCRSAEFLKRTIGLCDHDRSVVILFDPDSAARSFWLADFHDRARVFASFTDVILFEREFCRESFSHALDVHKLRRQ